jgi:hypothetical protein
VEGTSLWTGIWGKGSFPLQIQHLWLAPWGQFYLLQVHAAKGELAILRSQKARFDSSLLHPGKENMHKLNRKLQILLTLVATFGAQG